MVKKGLDNIDWSHVFALKTDYSVAGFPGFHGTLEICSALAQREADRRGDSVAVLAADDSVVLRREPSTAR